jgi:hypothetical protein
MHTVNAAASPALDSLKINGAVSAAVGLTALVAAAAIWFIGHRHWPRVVVVLVMTASAGLAGSALGDWLRSLVGWANDTAASVTTRWTGTAVNGLLAAVAVYALVIRFKERKVDYVTLAVALFTPLVVSTIPGAIGQAALTAIAAVTGVAGWGIGQALGLA